MDRNGQGSNFGQIVVPGGFNSDFTFTFVRSGGSPHLVADLVDPFDFWFYLNDIDHGNRDDGREAFQMFGYDSCLLSGSVASDRTDPEIDMSASYDVGLTPHDQTLRTFSFGCLAQQYVASPSRSFDTQFESRHCPLLFPAVPTHVAVPQSAMKRR